MEVMAVVDRQRDREYPLFAPVLDWQLQVDQQHEEQAQDHRLHRHQELEFRFFSSSSSSSASAAMIWADEIFSNGKMLPCDLDAVKNNKVAPPPPPAAAAPPPPPPPPAAINRSPTSSLKKKSIAVVATATCSSHWKEIFHRLRLKPRSSPPPPPQCCYESSSGSLSSTDTPSSSSRQLLLLHDHCRHGEQHESSMEPLIDHPKRKSSSRQSKQRIPAPADRNTSMNSSRSSRSSSSSSTSRVMRVSSFDGRSSSRVYPGNGSGGGGDQPSFQTSRRSFSKDQPHRRSLSSFLYDQQQHQQQHHFRHQSVTPVLNMPACMGDSFVVVSTSSSSSSSKMISRAHSKSKRKTT